MNNYSLQQYALRALLIFLSGIFCWALMTGVMFPLIFFSAFVRALIIWGVISIAITALGRNVVMRM
jgi:hypothetical protein